MNEAYISKHVKGKLNVWREGDNEVYALDNELGLLIILWLLKIGVDPSKKDMMKIIGNHFNEINDYEILHIVICDDNTFELYLIK